MRYIYAFDIFSIVLIKYLCDIFSAESVFPGQECHKQRSHVHCYQSRGSDECQAEWRDTETISTEKYNVRRL